MEFLYKGDNVMEDVLKVMTIKQLNQLDIDKWALVNKWASIIADKKILSEDDYANLIHEFDELTEKYWAYGKTRNPNDDKNNHYVFNTLTPALDTILLLAKKVEEKESEKKKVTAGANERESKLTTVESKQINREPSEPEQLSLFNWEVA